MTSPGVCNAVYCMNIQKTVTSLVRRPQVVRTPCKRKLEVQMKMMMMKHLEALLLRRMKMKKSFLKMTMSKKQMINANSMSRYIFS